MTESMIRLLLQLCEAGDPAILWGRQTKPYLGREFERLLARGILIEEAPATNWSVCASCECDLDARLIQTVDGRLVAACPLDRKNDVVLDSEDIRTFSINVAALVREIAAASGFTGEPSLVTTGIWHLGKTPTKRATFLALSSSTVLQPGLVGTLRLFDGSSQITLIAPQIPAAEQVRFAETGIMLALIGECIVPSNGGHGFTINLAKLEPPPQFAPSLVIRRAAQLVELYGIPCALSDQSFKLLGLLAETACTDNPYATPRDIEACIWGDSVHRVSRAARDVVRELRDALAAGASDPDTARKLIENSRNHGWRLTLAAAEIDLRS